MPPYRKEDFRAVVFRALDRSASAVRGNVFSFVAAKSGSGATVTALNVAGSLARDFHRKVLLIEADISSGPIAFMLNLRPEQSIGDALDYSNQLTETVWSQMIARVDNLDLLTASVAIPSLKPSQFSYFRLIQFAQQHYDEIIVDLPPVIDDAAEPLLTHSKGINLVCTPDLTSLALVRRRLYQMELRGVRDPVVRVILNRYDQVDWTKEEIEERIGHKIAAELPNNYWAVQQAVKAGVLADRETKLGKAYTDLAATLIGEDAARIAGGSKLRAFLRKLGPAPRHDEHDEGSHFSDRG